MILQIERLVLRHYRLDDLEDLFEIFSDPVAMKYYPSTKTIEQSRAWINWNLENYKLNGFGLWAVVLKETGKFIGDCGITLQTVQQTQEHEIGYHIKRQYWNQGFATEAALACLERGFSAFRLKRLVSIVDPNNAASCVVAGRIHQDMRYFEKDGKQMCLYFSNLVS
ncbi:MAG TPA: GNAT family N-acetyltransferase [Blastocatellia bacterium]|nr:GNAT family N-acetyltransferase [Blastocatellia bacterium]